METALQIATILEREDGCMYKILIADDEAWIRERLAQAIDWASIGAEVAGEACDGEEALEKCRISQPEILLTDIRMPCVNGLELIGKLKEQGYTGKIIIISGYDDFQYAQQAVKLGAHDYILKPVDDGELLKTVQNAIEKLEQEKKREETLSSLQQQLEEQLPRLRERFVRSLLTGYFSTRERAKLELDYFHIENENLSHICFVIQMDDAAPLPDDLETAHLVQFGLCNITRDFIDRLGSGYVLISQQDQIVGVVSSPKSPEALARQALSISHGIRTMVKRVLDQTITIGVGNPCGDLLDISLSFNQARQALINRNYFGNGGIYTVETARDTEKPVACRNYDMDFLCGYIKAGKEEEAQKALDAMLDKVVSENAHIRPVDIRSLYINIIFSAMKAASEYKEIEERFNSMDVGFFRKLDRLNTMEELRHALSAAVKEITGCIEAARCGNKRRIVEMALTFIEDHYSEPISLSDVAEAVYLNPSYFCKIFKNETGESFTKSLMKFRINKAIALLQDPRLKIYEIAEMVGYSDVQYFTKIFKSVAGVVPTYYRDKVK